MSKTIYTEIYNPNGNFLFTIDQLNNAKFDEKCLAVKCMHCKRIYFVSKHQYNCFLNGRDRLKYCSRNCSRQSKPLQVTKSCLNCGKLVTKCASEAQKYPNFFCCKSCAASYNNKRRLPRSVESRAKTSLAKRTQKLKRSKICKVCGQSTCLRPDVCCQHILTQKSPNLQKLGFDITSLGTPRVYEEWDKLYEKLYNLYITQKLSTPIIKHKFNLASVKTIWSLLHALHIPIRDYSQGTSNAILCGRAKLINHQNKYKHGWHTAWNNKHVYYRSSYELDYCSQLDEQQIDYDMEYLRIEYWDSVKQKQRIAIPDFYLPSTNTIVEIKSLYTYDKQNMIDKSDQYKKLGYQFKLILEGVEYLICP